MDWEFDESYGPAYEVAQICLNGHVINDCARTESVRNQEHCQQCGESTTTKCNSCASEIRGRLMGPGIVHIQYFLPSYCWKCGRRYPWTERRLQAAKDFADELDELNESERETLKQSIDVLAKDSPASEVGLARVKKIFQKLGQKSKEKMYGLLVDVGSEVIKKKLDDYIP